MFVDGEYLKKAVKPKQFLHIDQAECILCESCVDICPWKCIHYLSIDAIDEALNLDDPRQDASNLGMFVVDEDECTRCALCDERRRRNLRRYDPSVPTPYERMARI